MDFHDFFCAFVACYLISSHYLAEEASTIPDLRKGCILRNYVQVDFTLVGISPKCLCSTCNLSKRELIPEENVIKNSLLSNLIRFISVCFL
jgi:hypothetical protein